jgi:hypothetical protein
VTRTAPYLLRVLTPVLQGVHIHGNEPSALFNEHDPYWEVHNDSAFAPQPQEYLRVNTTAMIMEYWLYNRTAWLLHSQVGGLWWVTRGLSRCHGTGCSGLWGVALIRCICADTNLTLSAVQHDGVAPTYPSEVTVGTLLRCKGPEIPELSTTLYRILLCRH